MILLFTLTEFRVWGDLTRTFRNCRMTPGSKSGNSSQIWCLESEAGSALFHFVDSTSSDRLMNFSNFLRLAAGIKKRRCENAYPVRSCQYNGYVSRYS